MGENPIEDIILKCITSEIDISLKYKDFAKTANEEGYPNISRLFKALTVAEEIHINMFYRIYKGRNPVKEELDELMKKIEMKDEKNDTITNLDYCLKKEHYIGRELYDKYAKAALKYNNPGLFITLKQAAEASISHEEILSYALENISKGNDLPIDENIYICPTCGLVMIDDPPFKCPICNERKSNFIVL